MHYQIAPFAEAKLVRCTRGAIFDVAARSASGFSHLQTVDRLYAYRPQSPHALHPRGLRARFLTLENDCEVFYQMSQFYNADPHVVYAGMIRLLASTGRVKRKSSPNVTPCIRIST